MRWHRALAMIAASLMLFASQSGGQQPVHRIGVPMATETPENAQALLEGLRERGYVVGRNLQIDYRYSQGRTEQIPALVAELVALGPEVIVASTSQNAIAVRAGAPTVPLVFIAVADPVALGLVESLAHPGGNVTGLSMMTTVDLNSKRLQLLKELNPQLTRVAVMWNPDLPLHGKAVEDLKTKAPKLSIDLSFIAVQRPEQFDQAFSDISRAGVKGLYVMGDPIFFAHWASLRKLISTAGLSTIYDLRRWPEAGGLMSYGPDIYDLFRRSAIYVDKILKGAKPADLPVEQPIKLELVINMKTAKALGLTIPPSLLQRADEVIQ